MSSSGGGGSSKAVHIREDVLNDLATRFLINIPDEDKDDPLKLCSHIEVAHWFYLDLMRPEDNSLPGCSMKEFMATIFKHCPFLVRDSVAKDLDTLQSQWRSHKYSRPTRGAIILNHNLTKCLLVQGYPASTSWGFPKGKQERGESDEDCAIREAYEETGFDIRQLIQSEHYLELSRESERTCRLYIVPGVPENTVFKPRVRKEIRDIQWFKVDDLPRHKRDLNMRQHLRKNPSNFFMIIPFISQLKKWISNYLKTRGGGRKSNRSVSASFSSPSASLQQQPARSSTTPHAVTSSSSSSSSSVPHPRQPPITNASSQRQRQPLLPHPHTITSSHHHQQASIPPPPPTRALSGPVLPGGQQALAVHGPVIGPVTQIRPGPGSVRIDRQPSGIPLRSYSIPHPVSIPYHQGQHQPGMVAMTQQFNPQLNVLHPLPHSLWQPALPYPPSHRPSLPSPSSFPSIRPANYIAHPSAFNPIQAATFNPIPVSTFNPVHTSVNANPSAFNPVQAKETNGFNPFAALGISTVAVSEGSKVGTQAGSIPNQWNRNVTVYRPVQVRLKPSQSMCQFGFDTTRIITTA